MRGVPWKRWIVVFVTLAALAALVVRRSGCSYRQRRERAQPVQSAERAPVVAPGYQDLQNRYGDRGLVVIGIALDADPATVARFAKEHRIHYTLALTSPEVQDKFGGILGLPTTILVDRDGVIRKKVIGFKYEEAFESAVKEIL